MQQEIILFLKNILNSRENDKTKKLLIKNKEIVGYWLFFVIAIYFIDGIDAIMRLKKGGDLGEYTEYGMPIHAVSKDGLPDVLFLIVSGGVILVFTYFLLRGIVLNKWKSLTVQWRLLGLFFLFYILVQLLLYIC